MDRCGGLNFSMGLSDRAQSEHKMQSIHVPSIIQWGTMKIVPNSPVHRRQQYISPAIGLSHVPSHILMSGLALTCTSWLDTANSHRNVSHDKSLSCVESDSPSPSSEGISWLCISVSRTPFEKSSSCSSLSSSHQRFFHILTQELQQAVHKRYSPASKDHITFFSFLHSLREGRD